MKNAEDPRIRVARRAFAPSWLYFTLFVAAMLGAAFGLGNELCCSACHAGWRCRV